jgi:hypothetical protein
MSGTEDPLWRALAAAEQDVTRLRAEFNRRADRTEILARALAKVSIGDRATALEVLRIFPNDVPRLLEELVDLGLSIRWLTYVRELLRAACSESLLVKLDEVVADIMVENTHVQDYNNIANMLAYVEAWGTLAKVLDKARVSADPEVREVADDFTRSYGGKLPSR